MGVADKHSGTVRRLYSIVNNLPSSAHKTMVELMKIRDFNERKQFLSTLNSDMVSYLLKSSVYFLISSEALTKGIMQDVYLTTEEKNFFSNIQDEIEKSGELTKQSVSYAVDIAVSGKDVFSFTGIITTTSFLILNPAVGLELRASLNFFEMLMFLLATNEERMG